MKVKKGLQDKHEPTPQYKGILKEKIPIPADGTEYMSLVLDKLEALLDHYDVSKEPGMWVMLAFHLARDHVPGFKIEQPPRRRLGKRTVDDLTIFVEINRLVESGKSVNSAAQILANRNTIKGLNKEGIRQRYVSLKRGVALLGKLDGNLSNLSERDTQDIKQFLQAYELLQIANNKKLL